MLYYLRCWHLIERHHKIVSLSSKLNFEIDFFFFLTLSSHFLNPGSSLHSHQWSITQYSEFIAEINRSTCLLECFHRQKVVLVTLKKSCLGPQNFFHYQEALEEMEVCNFLPPTHSFLPHLLYCINRPLDQCYVNFLLLIGWLLLLQLYTTHHGNDWKKTCVSLHTQFPLCWV